MVTTVLIVLLILALLEIVLLNGAACCSNPSSRVRLKMPGKTKTSAYFHTLRFFGGRGWMSRAALLKQPTGLFCAIFSDVPQLFESTLESET